MKYSIFISYRRLDENGNISGRDQARLIAKQLELAGFSPFFDYSEIKDGEFDKVIIPAIESCKVFILVLTKDSLNRCANADDWVRQEIETAIRSECKIVNVTPDNSFNGWPISLPESISKIRTIEISDIHFGSLFEMSMEKLIKDRILPVLSTTEKDLSFENVNDAFREACKSLYFALKDIRNAWLTVDQKKIISATSELHRLIEVLYSYSEFYRYSNVLVSNQAKNIVDQYNNWVDPYNGFANSDRVSESAQLLAKQADEEFNVLIDVVVKALSM